MRFFRATFMTVVVILAAVVDSKEVTASIA